MNKLIEELAIASGIYDSLCDPYDALKYGTEIIWHDGPAPECWEAKLKEKNT